MTLSVGNPSRVVTKLLAIFASEFSFRSEVAYDDYFAQFSFLPNEAKLQHHRVRRPRDAKGTRRNTLETPNLFTFNDCYTRRRRADSRLA